MESTAVKEVGLLVAGCTLEFEWVIKLRDMAALIIEVAGG